MGCTQSGPPRPRWLGALVGNNSCHRQGRAINGHRPTTNQLESMYTCAHGMTHMPPGNVHPAPPCMKRAPACEASSLHHRSKNAPSGAKQEERNQHPARTHNCYCCIYQVGLLPSTAATACRRTMACLYTATTGLSDDRNLLLQTRCDTVGVPHSMQP